MPKRKTKKASSTRVYKMSSKSKKVIRPKTKKANNLLENKIDQKLFEEILIKSAVRFLKKPRNSSTVKLIVNGVETDKVEEKLQKANVKVGKALSKKESTDEVIEQTKLEDLDDLDLETIKKLEKKGVRIIYPNLKYRKPKYQNVESVLNYVESENGSNETIKLVIMNFND